MNEVTARVDRLEEALAKLAHAQYLAELQIRDLAQDMRESKNEMREFKNEMLAFKDEMRGFKDEMLAFKNEMREFKDEMREFKREVRAEQKEMNRRWGEAVNRWGSIAEDLVYPNVPRIARERFAAEEFEITGLRVKRKHARLAGRMREFDAIAAWPGSFLIVEVKATLRPEYLKSFATFVKEGAVWDYFPEYRTRRLIPIFASFSLPDSDLAYLTSQRIYGMALGDSTMEIMNFEAIAAQPPQ